MSKTTFRLTVAGSVVLALVLVMFLMPSPQAAATGSSIQYKVVHNPYRGYADREILDEIESVLNEQGYQGWELVHAEQMFFIFKK